MIIFLFLELMAVFILGCVAVGCLGAMKVATAAIEITQEVSRKQELRKLVATTRPVNENSTEMLRALLLNQLDKEKNSWFPSSYKIANIELRLARLNKCCEYCAFSHGFDDKNIKIQLIDNEYRCTNCQAWFN